MDATRLPLAALAALACCAALPATLQAQSSVSEALRPFEYLVGSCWKGTFPSGRATDEHCFEPLFDGQFVRDRHIVRGNSKPYSGETTYAWDAAKKRIVYWYITADGGYSTGHVEGEGDAIVIPETYVSANGTRELRNIWRRTGDDAYTIEVYDVTGGGSTLLWSMEMKRQR